MNGIKYLIDTNIIIGLLKSDQQVIALAERYQIALHQCACSVITRMELLSYPNITDDEQALISNTLKNFKLLAIIEPIEDIAIKIRQKRKVKLPDAIILATADYYSLGLISLDQQLMRIALEQKQ